MSAPQKRSKLAHKQVLGLWAFWSAVIALTAEPGMHWLSIAFGGLLAAGATVLLICLLLLMFGVGGFLVVVAGSIGITLWLTVGPVATIILTAAAIFLLWRFRFQIARAAGVQTTPAPTPEPEAPTGFHLHIARTAGPQAPGVDTSSAAASSQDSKSGTSI